MTSTSELSVNIFLLLPLQMTGNGHLL